MATLSQISDSVRGVGSRLDAIFTAHNWNKSVPMIQIFGHSGPQMPEEFIVGYVNYTADRVKKVTALDLKNEDLGKFLESLPSKLDNINFANIGNDADAAIGSIVTMMQIINERLPLEKTPPPEVDWEKIKDKDLLPKDLSRRLRSVEANLKTLEPRAMEVKQKIDEIEAAHNAAEQLPTDLEELASQREIVQSTIDQIKKAATAVEITKEQITQLSAFIEESQEKVEKLIVKSEQALRGSTGVGLANAFQERKVGLTISGICWVVGLIAALTLAVVIGAERVATLKDVLISDRSATVIWVNALLTIFGIGAPVWFAWLATKHIGNNFRLAEDYAFKASVSKAYEGYRKEAVELNSELQERLFASALTRLEEAPIRLIDNESHSSPLQELLNNPTIRKSLENIPDIADKIMNLIPGKKSVVVPLAVATSDGVNVVDNKEA